MNRISVLDCTLRDGGYVNSFEFGEKVIRGVISKLTNASIDIIECGFLVSGELGNSKTLFGGVELVSSVIDKKNSQSMYVAMLQYGKITNEEICTRTSDDYIDGIRLTFHEHEIDGAFILGRQLMDKGYKVFMQPVGTTTYSDDELLKLVNKINELNPFAFYLVDTLGTMYKNDLLRMFYLIDHNLKGNIVIGFHSHNNLQLSFANAQEMIQLNSPRCIIIDSSIYGMGRGAGNLNTELLTQYLNSNFGLKYDNLEILEAIDDYIKPIYRKYEWGYDIAYYIASVTGCHPNYASFLLNKQTMSTQSIFAILNGLDNNRKYLYDKEYIGNVYLEYMSHKVDDADARSFLKTDIQNKKVVVIAPGKSISSKELHNSFNKDEHYIISVNFIPEDINVDTLFVSNFKRFNSISSLKDCCKNVFVTSNITTVHDIPVHIVDYSSYLSQNQSIADNAGLMCINLLKKIGMKSIILVGFDGFLSNMDDNYYDKTLQLNVDTERLESINKAMKQKFDQLKHQMEITFFTESLYDSK